jgi:hypothetical protein
MNLHACKCQSSSVAVARLKNSIRPSNRTTETIEINGKSYHINRADVERAIYWTMKVAPYASERLCAALMLLVRIADMVLGKYRNE